MDTLKTVLLIIQALSAVALTLVVTLQSGKSAGLSGA
ncbi:MAG: preprotein translocase subunit SecG, partial [Oscillospiraceae bacterium]|nr:preprotein translocase subunit SecG [Oscillospiraceae bacterium]